MKIPRISYFLKLFIIYTIIGYSLEFFLLVYDKDLYDYKRNFVYTLGHCAGSNVKNLINK